MNIYILSFFDKNTDTLIQPVLNHIFKDTRFTIVDDFDISDICFIFLQNSKFENREHIFRILGEFDNDIDIKNNIKFFEMIKNSILNAKDEHSEHIFKILGDVNSNININNDNVFFGMLKNIIVNSKDKKFIMYSRMDRSTIPEMYIEYFLKHENFKLLIKDYVTDYLNGIDFLIESRKLLEPSIEHYFHFKNNKPTNENKWGIEFKNFDETKLLSNKKIINEYYKNKIYIFTLKPNQYLFWEFKDNRKSLKFVDTKRDLSKKIYDVFFCKHQRATVDGVARRYVHDIVMPKIKEKFINTIFFENVNSHHYNHYLAESKIAISCYGLGERVNDDCLAPLYNTIVIKPLCDNVYDYTNLFTNKTFNKYHKLQFTQHIVFCKPDFSDLLDVITHVLDNYDFYLERVKTYKKECEEYLKTNKFKNDFLETLTEALEN